MVQAELRGDSEPLECSGCSGRDLNPSQLDLNLFISIVTSHSLIEYLLSVEHVLRTVCIALTWTVGLYALLPVGVLMCGREDTLNQE